MDLNEKEVSVDNTEVSEKEKAMAEAMGKAFAAEMKDAQKEVKEVKEVPAKVADSHRIEVKAQKCDGFDSKEQMESFALEYVPKHLLESFGNKAALSTYQNIATDADGGSFDPIDAKGILANSTEIYPSYVEDTLQVKIFNSVGTFIDHTSDATAYVIGEGVAGTQSKPGNTTRTLTQKKIITICPVTNEVFRFGTLADVASETVKSMRAATSKKKQHLIFTADGTVDTNDGGVSGTIKTITDVGTTTATNKAIYEVAGNWGALDNDDISSIATSIAPWANPAKYAWYCNQTMWGYLESIARALGGNQYLVQTGQRPIPMLFGFPIKFVNQMPSAFAEDEVGLLFGDLSSMTATGSDGNMYMDSNAGQWFDQDVTALRLVEHMAVNTFQPGSASVTPGMRAVIFGENS